MQKERLFTILILSVLLTFSSFVVAQEKDQGGRPLSATLAEHPRCPDRETLMAVAP